MGKRFSLNRLNSYFKKQYEGHSKRSSELISWLETSSDIFSYEPETSQQKVNRYNLQKNVNPGWTNREPHFFICKISFTLDTSFIVILVFAPGHLRCTTFLSGSVPVSDSASQRGRGQGCACAWLPSQAENHWVREPITSFHI